MTTDLTPEQKASILTPNVERLMTALRNAGGEARVVGGAVRDVLLARKVGDIDLATTLPPNRVMAVLSEAGLKTVPTGFTHGTITAVADHVGYEITTLRRDEKTDGRHAHVAYTDDWREDAMRRDFTMNALYVDAAGRVTDYFDGLKDARAGCIRFIGDPRARIREDVLRILRFFRFQAFFGKGDADPAALDACRELAPLIPSLSAERIAHEFLKLLLAEAPLPALHLMKSSGVLPRFLPEADSLSRLHALLETEKRQKAPPHPLIRFAALLPEDKAQADIAAARLRLSNSDSATLAALAELPALMKDNLKGPALHRMLYKHGRENCRAAALLVGGDIASALAEIDAWPIPTFPIKGEDLVILGIPPGPPIGRILRAVEDWWIARDFAPDRAACLAAARESLLPPSSPPSRG